MKIEIEVPKNKVFNSRAPKMSLKMSLTLLKEKFTFTFGVVDDVCREFFIKKL